MFKCIIALFVRKEFAKCCVAKSPILLLLRLSDVKVPLDAKHFTKTNAVSFLILFQLKFRNVF